MDDAARSRAASAAVASVPGDSAPDPAAPAGASSAPPLPPLPTLDLQPSWTNRAGRIDRSACLEVRASELWPRVPPLRWGHLRLASGSPGRPGSPGSSVCEARAKLVIGPRLVFELHQRRLPRELQGDLRTPKSNAMKGRGHAPKRSRKLKPGEEPWQALAHPYEARYANPNKGATRTKRLALFDGSEPGFAEHERWRKGWKQTITIERWSRTKKSEIRRQKSDQSPMGGPPAYQHFLICPQCNNKFAKLFMALATKQEVTDSELAEGWVKRLDARQRASRIPQQAELLKQRAQLIDRYGPLFRDRRLVCRKCLGLRYGEVKRKPSSPASAMPPVHEWKRWRPPTSPAPTAAPAPSAAPTSPALAAPPSAAPAANAQRNEHTRRLLNAMGALAAKRLREATEIQ